jgi:hypothetical protein
MASLKAAMVFHIIAYFPVYPLLIPLPAGRVRNANVPLLAGTALHRTEVLGSGFLVQH